MNLEQEIKQCQKCDLYKICKQPIPWDWNFNSKILFIWEAPWSEEEKQWKPFVGRSWKLLDSILSELSLTRQKNYYITNIVKCRPDWNKDPNKKQINICSNFLKEQIEKWNFKLIVTLWRFSMNFFDTELKISKDHWKILKIKYIQNQPLKKEIILLPCYHPAFALYNPSKKDLIKKDLQKIKSIINIEK